MTATIHNARKPTVADLGNLTTTLNGVCLKLETMHQLALLADVDNDPPVNVGVAIRCLAEKARAEVDSVSNALGDPGYGEFNNAA